MKMEETRIDKVLALEFFLGLSKTEYALKAAGYITGTESNPQPKWDAFSVKIRETFDIGKTGELREACEFYLSAPPQKQFWNEKRHLTWRHADYSNRSTCEKLFLWVRCVRNNLFHGGKCNQQYGDETERNEHLLRYGITILKEGVSLDPDVSRHFDEAAI